MSLGDAVLKSRLYVDLKAMSGFVAKAYTLRRMHLFEAQMAMRGYANLKTKVHVFEGESHGSVPPVALIRGLRFVFAPIYIH